MLHADDWEESSIVEKDILRTGEMKSLGFVWHHKRLGSPRRDNTLRFQEIDEMPDIPAMSFKERIAEARRVKVTLIYSKQIKYKLSSIF